MHGTAVGAAFVIIIAMFSSFPSVMRSVFVIMRQHIAMEDNIPNGTTSSCLRQ